MIETAYEVLNLYLKNDLLTFQHSKRVAQYTRLVAKFLKLNDNQKELLVSAALLHDLGKAKVPQHILYKQGKLTADEFQYIFQHPIYGEKIVKNYPKLKEVCPIILCHHERVDGNGYPYKIKQNDIPKFSRLISVIDAYDSMIEYRPYQHPKDIVEAIHELMRFKDTQFDKQYVEYFVQWIVAQGMAIYNFRKTI